MSIKYVVESVIHHAERDLSRGPPTRADVVIDMTSIHGDRSAVFDVSRNDKLTQGSAESKGTAL